MDQSTVCVAAVIERNIQLTASTGSLWPERSILAYYSMARGVCIATVLLC